MVARTVRRPSGAAPEPTPTRRSPRCGAIAAARTARGPGASSRFPIRGRVGGRTRTGAATGDRPYQGTVGPSRILALSHGERADQSPVPTSPPNSESPPPIPHVLRPPTPNPPPPPPGRRVLHLVVDRGPDPAARLAAIRAAAANGVDWVQVRDHGATAAELYAFTVAVLAECRPSGVRVAVNDRVDVALAAGADGVQLGARSLPLAVVRALAPRLACGGSVHDRAAAPAAAAAGAAWLTFGHVFPSASHPDEPPRGLAALAEVVSAVALPVIAIGGIGPAQVPAVCRAGAAGVAVISAILAAPDPGAAAAALRRALDETGI
jgi:thiamine-phosphate diphosphorylase